MTDYGGWARPRRAPENPKPTGPKAGTLAGAYADVDRLAKQFSVPGDPMVSAVAVGLVKALRIINAHIEAAE